jgi:hypothetical protein
MHPMLGSLVVYRGNPFIKGFEFRDLDLARMACRKMCPQRSHLFKVKFATLPQ